LPKPTSIRMMNLLIYFKLAFILFILILHFMLLVVPESAWSGWGSFKHKQLEALQITEYTAGHFGSAAANLAIPAAIIVVTLLFIRSRKFFPALVSNLVMFVLFPGDMIQQALTLVIIALFFSRTARAYFRGTVLTQEAGRNAAAPIEAVQADDDGQAASDPDSADTPEPRKPRPSADLEVSIRHARPEDADTIHSLMLIAFDEYRAAVPPSSALEETSEGIHAALVDESESAAILYEDDIAVAMVRYKFVDDAIWFFRLSVVPPKRRRGYARQLVKWIEHQGVTKGMNASRCKVRQTVQNNVAMYQNMGYEIIDQELVVREGGTVKTLTLEKKLTV